MYNGKRNKQSGILVVNLPEIEHCSHITAGHGEQQTVYPEFHHGLLLIHEKNMKSVILNMPERIIDNLLNLEAKISVTKWSKIIQNPKILKFLIDATFEDRVRCDYDLRRPMRRQNFNPHFDLSPNL